MMGSVWLQNHSSMLICSYVYVHVLFLRPSGRMQSGLAAGGIARLRWALAGARWVCECTLRMHALCKCVRQARLRPIAHPHLDVSSPLWGSEATLGSGRRSARHKFALRLEVCTFTLYFAATVWLARYWHAVAYSRTEWPRHVWVARTLCLTRADRAQLAIVAQMVQSPAISPCRW